MKGESAIWNVLLSATGASFLIVAIALVAYSMRSNGELGDAPDAGVTATEAAETAADAGNDATAATETAADAGAGDASAAEDAADAATEDADDPDSGPVVASAVSSQKPLKSKPSKTKPIRTKTRKPR